LPFTKINQLHYRSIGSGPPLIFVHGVLYDSRGYKQLLKLLAKKYTVYALDLPMHGFSPAPSEYLSLDSFVNVVRELVQECNIKNPIVCAHSAGAMAAMLYAKQFRVKELWLFDPAGIPSSPRRLLGSIIFRTHIKYYLLHPLRMLNAIIISLYNLIRYARHWKMWRVFREAILEDFRPVMKKITCPVTLFWGEDDTIIPLTRAKEFLKYLSKAKLITFKHCHDWPVLEPGLLKSFILK